MRVRRRVSAWALPRPSASGFGKVGKDDREPEPETGKADKELVFLAGSVKEAGDEDDSGDQAAHFDHEHHRVFELDARVKLGKGGPNRLPNQRRVEDATGTARAQPFGWSGAAAQRASRSAPARQQWRHFARSRCLYIIVDDLISDIAFLISCLLRILACN